MIKKELMKSSALIEIEHKITLLEHHLHNVLLAYAFKEMPKEFVHTIDVKILREYIPGIDSISCLKKSLQSLVETTVEYNIYKKDKIDVWGEFGLLSSARLDKLNKKCTYAFPIDLIPALGNPKIYAKINFNLQKQYKGGRYGWALYELCWDYKESISKGNKPIIGRTPTKSIDFLKKFFGISSSKYTDYKNFNRRVLTPAIQEVNQQTSIHLTTEIIKQGNTVHEIIFHITENKTHKKLMDLVPKKLLKLSPEKLGIELLKVNRKKNKEKYKQLTDKEKTDTIMKILEQNYGCRISDNQQIFENKIHKLIPKCNNLHMLYNQAEADIQ